MAPVLKLVLQICDYFIELFLLFFSICNQEKGIQLKQAGFSSINVVSASLKGLRNPGQIHWLPSSGENKLRASVTKPPSEAGIVPPLPNSSVRALWRCGKPGFHQALPGQSKQSPSYQVKGDAFSAVQISIFIHLDTECPKWSIWPLVRQTIPCQVKHHFYLAVEAHKNWSLPLLQH